MSKPCRILPFGANTGLGSSETGNLFIGKLTETGSGASANVGEIWGINEHWGSSGQDTYKNDFVAGDYLVIRYQEYGMLSVGQFIKVTNVSGTYGSAVLTLEDGAAPNIYSYLNSSGGNYTGQTDVEIIFEKVESWGVQEMTLDQIDESCVVPIFERWGSYTKGTAGNDFWKGHVRLISGTSATAGFTSAGYIGERYRSPDVVGDHPVANNVTITNVLLEYNSGSDPYNGTSFNETHVDDTDSIPLFIKLKDTAGNIQVMTESEMEDSTDSVIERCVQFYISAANTVGSYHIGTSPGDGDTGSWHSETFFEDNVIASSGAANTTYNLYRKEKGPERGWSGTRLLANANTAARAANSVFYFGGTNTDYIAVGNYPRAATDEVIYKPLYQDTPNLKETAYTAGISATLTNTANDAGMHLYWHKRLLRNVLSKTIGTYAFVAGSSAPGTGTWQAVGTCSDRLSTIGDVIYSQGYEGIYSQGFEAIYSQGFEGIYSAGFEGIYSQGFTAGYTFTYGSGGESPNPQASSEGPTYSGTYSQGFTGIYSQGFTAIYSGQFTGIYSGQFTGIYSNQYTGTTVFTVLEQDDYSFWKRVA
jgi:hypothetical protein